MNEQLEKDLAALIQKTMEGVDTAAEVLTQEIPEVIYQLLLWHGISSLISTLVGVVVLIALYVVLKKYGGQGEFIKEYSYGERYKETITHDEHGELDERVFFTAAASVMVFCFTMASINLAWLKILIAPKVWLLEYAAKLAG